MAGTNPRAARIAALIQRVIASSMEAQLHDQRLHSVTITEVRVTNDLQIARVYWTQLGQEGKAEGERRRAQQALNHAKGRLRTLVGAKAGLRLTPQLQFIYDEVPSEATEIEDILAAAHHRDEELLKLRETAHYAGEEDPYKKPAQVDDSKFDGGISQIYDTEDESDHDEVESAFDMGEHGESGSNGQTVILDGDEDHVDNNNSNHYGNNVGNGSAGVDESGQ